MQTQSTYASHSVTQVSEPVYLTEGVIVCYIQLGVFSLKKNFVHYNMYIWYANKHVATGKLVES